MGLQFWLKRLLNNTRTVANVRSFFNKCNGSLGTSGSVVFMFDHTCNFRINAEGLDVDDIELEFIDYGAEEVFALRNSKALPINSSVFLVMFNKNKNARMKNKFNQS